ncbi:uncharacterized protein Nmag_0652 [Natrialba magadii ATCC 43099]|uniref:Uncharacterized protein n=1 Tax=Natrialba magadii (strain ATCC 43099 / DSM 3394 / CCM 3739 / CIP 104546 / IAM 13178 / JCM 8861 / NBRC 102185 / NCIMB 2190 / MS3) TaxID=547559 RepID=D3SZA3_NATMM|nr:DUF5794 domain-containing protein [Natrialba magadii]ADD04237.1 uncharacterized protein Nmag_0652 [Natrialba magadii ATCC 43099]ELY26640.1 hypothetical protein C500_15805 [Natrialba magadii ATCC 43099]
MSASQHPVALRLERLVGGDAKLLALVMMLPLIDGVFPALILAGAIDDPWSAIQVGLLIFGGSATVAVMLAEMNGTPREQVAIVLLVGIPLILLAAVQAALAPAIETVLNEETIKRFAAVVILAIAAKTASATIGEYLPSPGVIIGLGLVASIDPSGAAFTLMDDPALVMNATLAAVSGVAFALAIAISGPYLREYMDIDRFRFGSAVALGLLPLSLLGMAFGQAPLAALVVAALFAIEFPFERDSESTGSDGPSDGSSPVPTTASAATSAGTPSPTPTASSNSSPTPSSFVPAVGTGPLADGSEDSTDEPTTVGSATAADSSSTAAADATTAESEREREREHEQEQEHEHEHEQAPVQTQNHGREQSTNQNDDDNGPYPGDDTTETEGRAPWL